ncbi:MAG: CpsD/CapB family tyrosine-protein kinase, partial [Oscillospiraceae bacterium]
MNEQPPYLVGKDAPFALQEAIRSMRTNVLFAMAVSEKKSMVVSGTARAEGKSTVCANLAQSLAQADNHVLIIDADMRKPVQHRYFKQRDVIGLSHVLGGFNAPEQAILQEAQPGLDLLTSGKTPPNPSELLCSPNMRTLMDYAEAH